MRFTGKPHEFDNQNKESEFNRWLEGNERHLRTLAQRPLVNTGEDHVGWMKSSVWERMETTLREQEVLTNPMNIEQVYTVQFINEICDK